MKQTIEFPSDPVQLTEVRRFVRSFLAEQSFGEMEKELMVLGVDEACTNVMRYAYHHAIDQPMSLSCEEMENGVRFRLRDLGEQGDPASFLPRKLDDFRPGGLGVHLIRKAFHEVDYLLQSEGTELVLTRLFEAGPECA